MFRTFFTLLSRSRGLQRAFAEFGPARRVARRFVAGETLEDALSATDRLKGEGLASTLNQLGEHAGRQEDARSAAARYMELLERLRGRDLDVSLSVKPTFLGLGFGRSFFLETLRDVTAEAAAAGIFVEVDMEDSSTTDDTLAVYHALQSEYGNLRVALQAALHRAEEDLRRILRAGGSVRLVKGAYDEPADRAWRRTSEVDASFARLTELCFSEEARSAGFYPALGTHDRALVEHAKSVARERGFSKDTFEFQALLGVRRDLTRALAREGYRVRVYVPYGTQWYPYFMRRLAERPANALFLARAMVGR